mgnify:CR=1 FL=1
MQFPTQLPLDAAPTVGPETAPALAPSWPGGVQPPPTWDPYATPGTAPATLLPQDPTLPPMPDFGLSKPIGTQRLLQSVRVDYHWFPGNSQKELGIHDMEINGTFALPFFYNQQTPLLVTPGFGLHLFHGPEAPYPDLPDKTYDAYLEGAWHPQVTPWFGGELSGRVGVYTDFQTILKESVRVTGQGYAVLSFSPSFQIKGGVIYYHRVRIKLLPAGGIIWTPNPDVRFEILFPNPRIARRCTTLGNTDLWMYMRGDYGGGSWTVKHATIVPPDTDHYERVDYNDLRVAVGFEVRGLGGSSGYFEVGGAFDREVVYDDHPNSTFRPNPSVFLGAGLVY